MRFNPVYAASIGAIGALVVGVAAFAAMEPRPARTKSHGPGIQISLVAPVEPEVGEGSVMEVGELVDGYTHRAFTQVASTPDEAWLDDYADAAPMPISRGRWVPVVDEVRAAASEAIDTVRERPLSFGFDAPRPDYAEERRLRREAMDRREYERREFERRHVERREAQRRDMERRFERAAYEDSRRAPAPPWRPVPSDRLPPPSVDDTFY